MQVTHKRVAEGYYFIDFNGTFVASYFVGANKLHFMFEYITPEDLPLIMAEVEKIKSL